MAHSYNGLQSKLYFNFDEIVIEMVLLYYRIVTYVT